MVSAVVAYCIGDLVFTMPSKKTMKNNCADCLFLNYNGTSAKKNSLLKRSFNGSTES